MAQDFTQVRGWFRHQIGRLRPVQDPFVSTAPRPRVAVVCDSAAALPPEWIAAVSGGLLTVIPMPVIIGENVYAEDDGELETHISLALAAGMAVRTSRPSPGQFERAYAAAAAAGYEAVVSIQISSKLSGTAESALIAAGRSAIPVRVIDALTVGMAQGFGVQAAVAAAQAGAGAEDVVAAAEAALAATRVFFYVPSLDQLRRGGRIGLASSWLGTVLAIKPILSIRDGAVVPVEKVRTSARAIARMEVLAGDEIRTRAGRPVQAAVHHFGNEAEARELGARLLAECPELAAMTLSRLPAVLAAHAGLGVLVVVVADMFAPAQDVQTSPEVTKTP